MAKIIVEVYSHNRQRREMYKLDNDVVRIGRNFENDIVISDVFVSPVHLEITRQEDGWLMQDLESENGVYVRKFGRVLKEANLKSGDEIIIGKTRLVIYSPEHSVAPTRLLTASESYLHSLRNPLSFWLSLAALFFLYALETHLESSENLSIFKLASLSIFLLICSVVWAGIWAFVGRLIKNKANFSLQLTISAMFFIFMIPINNFSEVFGYLTNSFMSELVLYVGLTAVLYSCLLTGHLGIATNLVFKHRVLASTLITAFIVLLGALVYFTYKDEFDPVPKIYNILLPPHFKVVESRSIDDFLKRSEYIYDVHLKRRGK